MESNEPTPSAAASMIAAIDVRQRCRSTADLQAGAQPCPSATNRPLGLPSPRKYLVSAAVVDGQILEAYTDLEEFADKGAEPA